MNWLVWWCWLSSLWKRIPVLCIKTKTTYTNLVYRLINILSYKLHLYTANLSATIRGQYSLIKYHMLACHVTLHEKMKLKSLCISMISYNNFFFSFCNLHNYDPRLSHHSSSMNKRYKHLHTYLIADTYCNNIITQTY